MRIPRIFQTNLHVRPGEIYTLDERAYHHLIHVLRLKIGSKINLFNGHGGEYSATIHHISKRQCDVLIESYSSTDNESPIQIHLGQGIAKGERMDTIIQKAVELGCTTITPLFTQRSNVKLDTTRQKKRYQHWYNIIISASEQCGRNRLPILTIPMPLNTWLNESQDSSELNYVLTPLSQQSLSQQNKLSTNKLRLLIGPEGGLSPQELQSALAHHFIELKLGPRILRTETATISAISILQYQWGDLG